MIRRRSRNVMNLKPLSVLTRAEIYSCIYYFYYILSVAQDELNQADCVDFLLNIVNQLKMEDKFSQLLSGYVEELEKDNTLKKVDSEKTTYIEGTEIEEKYTCDKFINRIIPRGKRINNFNVNLYRVLYSEDSKTVFQLIISDLFFPQSIYENTSSTAFIERGGRKTGLHEYIDEDNEWDDDIDNENINPMSLEIDEKKLPLKIKRAINDLSKVRFLIDNADLSKKEAEILLILYRCQTIKPLYEQYSRIQSCFELVIQKIMHLSSREYSMLINKNGKLHSFGFLDENNCIEDDLTDCIDCGNLDMFFSDLVQPLDCSDAFDIKSFSVNETNTNIMKRFITGKMNSSLLLYGKPGSGKTQYAKSLIKECGYKALIFRNENELMSQNRALFRLNCFLSMNGNDNILIVDEADKLLQTKDINSMFGSVPNVMKGTVNKMFENSKYKTIWIVNYCNQIDISTKRRFNYSCKFEEMTEAQLRRIAKNKLNKLCLDDTDNEMILDMLGKYRVTGASVENVVSIIDEMRDMEKQEMFSTVDNILSENAFLLNGKRGMRQTVSEEYDLSVLNTSIPANQIVDMTENALDYASRHQNDKNGIRMLFYGLSGTGKTELARYLSQKLGKNIILKRASDILDKYVGESEKNIREAFEEAEQSDSILLFDEADSFFADRNSANNSWERTQVNEFLTQMEEFGGILICTTNLKNIMDSALQRRFHICVEFKPLTEEGVEILLNNYFGEYEFDEEQVNMIYESHSVTPGDFGSLVSRLRFMKQKDITSDYIVEELINLQKDKQNSCYSRRIGF